MGCVGVDKGDSLGAGNVAGAVERTLHNALVEVAGDGDAEASAGLVSDRSFVQHTGYHVHHRSAAGSCGLHPILQIVPNASVETILPLRRLIGVVEGLLVLLDRGLTVVRCHKMPSAIADGACIVQPGLLGETDGWVVGPAFVSPGVVVRPIGGVHSVRSPQGSVLAAVVQDDVVESLRAVWRTFGVCVYRYLTIVVIGAVAVPLVVAVAISAGGPYLRVEPRKIGHTKARQIVVAYRALGLCGEGPYLAYNLHIPAIPVADGHEGLIVVCGRRLQPRYIGGELSACGVRQVGRVNCLERQIAATCSNPEARILRGRTGSHPIKRSGQGYP